MRPETPNSLHPNGIRSSWRTVTAHKCWRLPQSKLAASKISVRRQHKAQMLDRKDRNGGKRAQM